MEEADKSPEEADKSPEEASEVNVESENQEDQDWNCPFVPSQSIVYLLRDLRTSVNNLQSAADAKELLQRQELEEARRSRLQRLQDEFKLSGDKFEEINEGWLLAKQKEIHQELQGALNKQEELCAALIEDKEKLIDDLKHELKVKDDCYVKDLRNQAEELDLIMERIEEQIKTLTKAYREELVQVEVGPESSPDREHQVLLTKDKTEWEQYMTEFMEKEVRITADIRNLLSQYSRQDAQFKRKNRYLLEDYKRSVLQYERIQKKIKHFAAADVRKFEEMWLVIEEEVKELVENALLVDSLICTKLGLAWQRPPMPFMELSGPIQPKKQLVQCSQMVMYQKGASGQAQSGAEQEQEKLMKAVLELMCDESNTSYIMLVYTSVYRLNCVQQILNNETCILFQSLGIDVEDLPKLSNFLVQYTQHKEQSEVRREGKRMHNSGRHRSSVEARDASEDEAYWDSMITATHLVPETQSLEQQNRELRMLLQQSLTSRVRHY
uniref:Dynein regulatory complex protein 1/2 N-terminal domain-containing protein n=1 Tax=Mola mola TaxID=94237 RepID=A0A3Q4BIY3_MOLML